MLFLLLVVDIPHFMQLIEHLYHPYRYLQCEYLINYDLKHLPW
jgi:hypothetical protein